MTQSEHNRGVRWRPYYLSRVEAFSGGVALGAALGYAFEGSSSGGISAVIVAAVLVADAIRRHGAPGLWLVALGFCAAVSRLNVTEADAALNALRTPVSILGSLLAMALGVVIDQEFRSGLRRVRL